MNFLVIVDIFLIFLLQLEIYCEEKFQKLSQLNNWIFWLIELYTFERNCLIR